MELGIKTYQYKNFSAYYLTLNGYQIGPIFFSVSQCETVIERLKNGVKFEDAVKGL